MEKDGKKYILLSGFTNEEVKKVINFLKSSKELPRIIFARTTGTVLGWTVKEWLDELAREDNLFGSK